MFKKAKLYSLLALIVASTMVGLLGFNSNVQAQSDTAAKWVEVSDGANQTITYAGQGYTYVGRANEADLGDSYWKNSQDFNNGDNLFFSNDEASSGSLRIFERLNSTTGEVLGIIYFTSSNEGGDLPGDITTQTVTGTYVSCSGSRPNTVCDGQKTTITIAGLATDEEVGEAEENTNVDPNPEAGDGDEAATPSSCDIKGLGWLICPMVHFLAGVIDASYWMLEHTFLRLEPIALPGGSSDNGLELYNSWKMMRDVANIVFIIGFLIIVFSQLTSFGVSNYGIKRLLPKIVIAAILVNLSYYICVIAVDLSNILGNALRGFIESGAEQSSTPLNISYTPDGANEGQEEILTSWTGLGEALLSGTFFPASLQGLVGAGAAAGIIYVFLPVFLPMLLTAALAIGAVILVLTLRQALIVMLVILSPLAFVALLLPNTESWFGKWRTLFMSMLFVYPAISVVFGASQLASQILMATNDFPTQLIGAGVSIIPLAITPLVMKVSGGLLNRWVGMVNDPMKGPIDGAKRSVKSKADRLDNRRKITALRGGGGRFLSGRYRRGAKNDAIDSGLKAEASRSSQQYVAEEIGRNGGDNKFAKQVAGGGLIDKADAGSLERAIANAQFTVQKAELEEVKAAGVTVESMNLSQLDKIMNNLDESGNARDYSSAQKAAALSRMVKIGDPGDYEDYVNSYGSSDKKEDSIVRSTLVEALSKDGPGFLKGSDLDIIGNGQLGKARIDKNGNVGPANSGSLAEIAESNSETGALSQAKMAADSKGNLEYLLQHASPRGKEILGETAERLLENSNLSGQIKHNKDAIEDMAKFAPPKPAQPTSSTNTPNQQAQPNPQPQAAPGQQGTNPPNQAQNSASPPPTRKTAGVSTAGWATTPSGFTYPQARPQQTPAANPQPQAAPGQPQPPVQGTRPNDV